MSFHPVPQFYQYSMPQNPQNYNVFNPDSETLKDCSTRSTRKSSIDSFDFKVKYKTEVCKFWINNQICPFQQSCAFAHGQYEVRSKQFLPSKYKTRICKKFQTGYCVYGIRCQFIHEKRKHDQKQNNYEKLLDIAKQDPQYFFLSSKRLRFFKNLTQPKSFNFAYSQPICEEDYYGQSGTKPRLYSL